MRRARIGSRTWPLAAGLAALFALAWSCALQAADLDAAIARRVAQARQVSPALGVHVMELESGAEVYGYRADTPRILASNTKLFTTAALFDALGPDFEYETPLLMRGPLYGGILVGDLAVRGAGDPNISGRLHGAEPFAIFREWARRLKQRGVERVRGDLLLVDGLFDRQWLHGDWPEDQLDRWYQAPVGALSFSDNCFLVRVRPGAEPGDPAIVEQVPDLGLYPIQNVAVTTARRRDRQVRVTRPEQGPRIRVSGRLHRNASPVEKWISVPDPVAHFAAALRAALAEQGITIEGDDRRVSSLPGAVWEQVARHTTNLETTLKVTNHRSQNFYAESLVKLLGAVRHGGGSWSAGLGGVARFLASIGLDPATFQVADGSGLSRRNRATPRQLTHLLDYMYSLDNRERFLLTLPASGDAQTSWNRRLAEEPYRGNVLAKTGTLNGVSTLSGYAKALSGRVYAFSLLFNETAVWRARQAQDRFLKTLIDEG